MFKKLLEQKEISKHNTKQLFLIRNTKNNLTKLNGLNYAKSALNWTFHS